MRTYHNVLLAIGLMSQAAFAADAVDPDYLAFQQARGEAPWINADAEHPQADSAYRPIPPLASFPADPTKRDLGFALFHDAQLSRDGSVGCNTCHMGMMGATDGLPLAKGIGGATGLRNTPTVFNSAFNFRQFWDGRAFDLDAQALGPITDPVEMGHNLDAVVEQLKADPGYASQFAAAYPDGVTAANVGNAIAQHSKDMTRTDSPFNAHLNDASNTLSEQAQRGLARFNALGCVSCHNGINLGGNSYQSAPTGATAPADQGLYRRTGRDEDRQVFKVPTLHNIAMTAPYFHDGSVATLEEAVAQMGQLQAGRTLSEEDVNDIVAFLGTLSSEFFGGGMMRGMSGEQLQSEMRQQMPDAMNHQNTEQMQGHDHQQHMMQMQQMQNPAPVQNATPAQTRIEAQLESQSQTHEQAYLAALEKVTQGEARIASELQRVQSGAVAHYDFLQYEHIELVRHARALAYPPSDMNSATRAAIATEAAQLVDSANAMEWVIADFLRAMAQVRSAASNTLDIAASLKQDAAGDQLTRLENLQVQTLLFMASSYNTGNSEVWSELSTSFEAVLTSGIGEQAQRELAFQRQQLEQYGAVLIEQQQKLQDSDVDELAVNLEKLYRS
ncbi:MAG: cytochrome c peroxidase [Gammaproteobacteria bacterium]|nr:cytochrome c peroxidase [Gammaproteobacteria bacterium]